jgi:hypothetical protein
VLLSYTGYSPLNDSDEELQGLLLIYKDFSTVYALEETLSPQPKLRTEQTSAYAHLKTSLCQILLAIKEQRNFCDVPKRHYMQYCQQTTIEDVLRQGDLFKAYDGTVRVAPVKRVADPVEDARRLAAAIEQL